MVITKGALNFGIMAVSHCFVRTHRIINNDIFYSFRPYIGKPLNDIYYSNKSECTCFQSSSLGIKAAKRCHLLLH